MGRRYVFCGGGTGGHVMPNLAVIREIQERDPSAEILYIGTARGAEAQLLRDAQIAFRSAPAKAFASPRRPRKFIPFVIALAIGVLKSLWHIARFKPDVVVATGGYVSVPPVLAAAILKRPVVLHEQNVEPGKANRLLARFATAIGVSFDDTLEYFPAKKVVVTGYPLRKRIATGDKAEARRRLAIPDDHRVCFVTGGSMGSRAINRAVVEGLNQLLANEKISVIHSTGLFETPEYNAFEDTKKRLGTIGLEPEKEGRYIYRRFFDNIEDAYAASDLIVARAGAGTLMEIAAMKKPAIFIPKGDAGDAHQLANALSAKKRGAAEVIYEEIYDEGGSAIARVHGDILAKKIRDLLLDDVKLDEMAKSNEGLVKPNAATRIFELVQKTAEGGEPAPRGTVPHLCGFLTSPDGREEEIIFTHSTASDRSTADIRLALRCRDRAIFRRYGKSAAETEFVIVPREGVVRVNEQTITKPVTLTVGDTVDIGPNRFTFSTKVMDVELPEGGRGMVRSVFATGIGTLASRLFGLTREAVLATSFGAGRVMDVFATSLNAANLLRRIFAENAADSAFLPTFLLAASSARR